MPENIIANYVTLNAVKKEIIQGIYPLVSIKYLQMLLKSRKKSQKNIIEKVVIIVAVVKMIMINIYPLVSIKYLQILLKSCEYFLLLFFENQKVKKTGYKSQHQKQKRTRINVQNAFFD